MRHRLASATYFTLVIFFLAAQVASAGPTDSKAAGDASRQPARRWTVYVLPHSHVDIGYTDVQPEAERLQWQALEEALDLCDKTAAYPPEARFKWNVEVLWAVDSYLQRATPAKRERLLKAVRNGQVGLDALYGNPLTAFYRPEELLRLMYWSHRIAQQCGVKIESAMIDDVPGCAWGMVSAMAEAGVKYLCSGPNLNHRIGRTLTAWEDKPFYWRAADGRHKVLFWIPCQGYTGGGGKLAEQVPELLEHLEKSGYPYDIAQLRWCRGDNRMPDAALSDAVKQWNATHPSVKAIITTTADMCRAFECRYGDKLPTMTGDFTPHWEDGAASSARETALNRTAAERLVQAETLSAMLAPRGYPAEQFWQAWRNVILYDEHTWGARQYNVIDYDVPFIRDQWKIKQAFALDGDAQSRHLLAAVLAGRAKAPQTNAVDVFNTLSWPRSDLVVLSKDCSAVGDVVRDPDGSVVPSQRLATGALAFWAKDMPALAGKRYTLGPGKAATAGTAKAAGTLLATATVSLQLDPVSGAIASLRGAGVDAELSDMKSGVGLNRYYYVLGDRVKEARQSGPAKIMVGESGPLVASLVVESAAPGCAALRREIRVVDGLDRVDIVDLLDKKEVRDKEGVHLGFAFNVPGGVMRLDIPWAVMRPETDQLPGACKEWLTVGRWADVSNEQYGVTWATLDAPLIEVGAITADKLGKSSDPNQWLAKLPPSQTLFSYVMNNYWITNYRAFQSGPTTFRYSLLPHKRRDLAAVQRFGIGCSQPLVIAAARGPAPDGRTLLALDSPDVIVASIKPSEDRQALIVRLFGAAGRPAKAALRWGTVAPRALWLSNLAEEKVTPVVGRVDVPAYGLVTLRAELPK